MFGSRAGFSAELVSLDFFARGGAFIHALLLRAYLCVS